MRRWAWNMRSWLAAGLLVAIGACFALVPELVSRSVEGEPPPPLIEIVGPPAGGEAKAHEDESCASGCSLAHHPVAPFTVPQFKRALAGFAATPLTGPPSKPLETLLFYGRRTRQLLREHGFGPLPAAHRGFLERELSRTHALVAIRIVDEHDEVRADLPWTRVPFGIKQHLAPRTRDIQPMEFNGTVMRTGLGHIWARY